MFIACLALVTILVLHMAQPYPSFLQWSVVNDITPLMVVSCLAHSIIEEVIFRYLFWSLIPDDVSVVRRASFIWLNVTLFWVAHVVVLYNARSQGSAISSVYESTSYNISILLSCLMFNAIYLDTGPRSLANCIAVHAFLLLSWTVLFGGGRPEYFCKYSIPAPVREVSSKVGRFVQDAVR